MKKLLYILLFSVIFLSGCEKKPYETAPASLFTLEDGMTEAGISRGDGPEEFIKAYRDYTIQVAYSNLESSYLVMSIDDIPYDEEIYTMIANLFVNGKPVTEEALCNENNISTSQLYSLLSSSDYLRSHEVIYCYLYFEWKDGVIVNLGSEELNYNETFEVPYIEKNA